MNYLTMSEEINIIDSLEKARDFLINKKDKLYLKWFIISFHHAVHCLMLYVLVDSVGGGIWQENYKKGLSITCPDGTADIMNKKNKLLNFMEAFENIQDSTKMNRYGDSNPFIAKFCHKDSMQKLNNNLRNEFLHYKPVNWIISEKYTYDVCSPILEIVKFLIFNNGKPHRFERDIDKLKKIIDKIDELIS